MEAHWMRRPLWLSAIIISPILSWCLYLALCWISALPLAAQVFLGAVVGLTSMASLSHCQAHRSHLRRLTSVSLAQLALADILALQRLLQDHDKALSWLPDPSDAELVRWINAGLDKIWPFFKEASSGLMKVWLQEVLNKYRTGPVEELSVGRVALGNSCPYVQGIKSVQMDEDDRTCLEIQLDWRQNEDQEILLHVWTSGPEYAIEVKNFVIYCVMRMTFNPLAEEIPCFGAIVFSIVEPPLIDFQTRFVGGDIKKMPDMLRVVDNILLTALMDVIVWPSRVVLPLLLGDYSELEACCSGHLHVHLLEAKELANKDIVGRADPYVLLFTHRRHDLMKESSRMHDTSEPIWKEHFLFNIEDPDTQRLTIKLMNSDNLGSDVIVGTAELAIIELEENVPKDLWIDLMGDPSKVHGKSAGKVHLLVEYKSLQSSLPESRSVSKALETPLTVSLIPSDENHVISGSIANVGDDKATDGLRAILEEKETRNVVGRSSLSSPVSASHRDSQLANNLTVVHAIRVQSRPFSSSDGEDGCDSSEVETKSLSFAHGDAIEDSSDSSGMSVTFGDGKDTTKTSTGPGSMETGSLISQVEMELKEETMEKGLKDLQSDHQFSRSISEETMGHLNDENRPELAEDGTDNERVSNADPQMSITPSDANNKDQHQQYSKDSWSFGHRNSTIIPDEMFDSEIFEVD